MSELNVYDLDFKRQFERNLKKFKKKFGSFVVDLKCGYICANDFKYYKKIGDFENVYIFYMNGHVVGIFDFWQIVGSLRTVKVCNEFKIK